jgi:hypothetical protein
LDLSNLDEEEEFVLPMTPCSSKRNREENCENDETPRNTPKTPVTPIANMSLKSIF